METDISKLAFVSSYATAGGILYTYKDEKGTLRYRHVVEAKEANSTDNGNKKSP